MSTTSSYYYNIKGAIINGSQYVLQAEIQNSTLFLTVTNITEMLSSEKRLENTIEFTDILAQNCQWKLDAPCRILDLTFCNRSNIQETKEFHLKPVPEEVRRSKLSTMFTELVDIHGSHRRAQVAKITAHSITSPPRPVTTFPIKRLGVKRTFPARSVSSDLIHPGQSQSARPAKGVQFSSSESD